MRGKSSDGHSHSQTDKQSGGGKVVLGHNQQYRHLNEVASAAEDFPYHCGTQTESGSQDVSQLAAKHKNQTETEVWDGR